MHATVILEIPIITAYMHTIKNDSASQHCENDWSGSKAQKCVYHH